MSKCPRVEQAQYEREYWPCLASTFDMYLKSDNDITPISYQQVYSIVYKCVCYGVAEQLFSDIKIHVTQHLHNVLQGFQDLNDVDFVLEVYRVMDHYFSRVKHITPIFKYMDRYYVEMRLNTTLESTMYGLFCDVIADAVMPKLMHVISVLQTQPFSISPSVLYSLLKNLYDIRPAYGHIYPTVFGRCLPAVFPHMTEGELETHQLEVRLLQERLRQNPEFVANNARKRPAEEQARPPDGDEI